MGRGSGSVLEPPLCPHLVHSRCTVTVQRVNNGGSLGVSQIPKSTARNVWIKWWSTAGLQQLPFKKCLMTQTRASKNWHFLPAKNKTHQQTRKKTTKCLAQVCQATPANHPGKSSKSRNWLARETDRFGEGDYPSPSPVTAEGSGKGCWEQTGGGFWTASTWGSHTEPEKGSQAQDDFHGSCSALPNEKRNM